MEQLKRAKLPYRFRIPDDMIPKLRSLRARQPNWRELIDAEDVVHLYYGLGSAQFLAFDGRVLVDNHDWDGTGAYEVSDPKSAWIAVVYPANRWDFPELLRILPDRPPHAIDCPRCAESGWLRLPFFAGGRGVVCEDLCGGLGWLGTATLDKP
jgi:hypothetical protein